AWTPALAAPPLSGKIAPILTVLSCADAAPASKTETAAAHTSPSTRLKLMLIVSERFPTSMPGFCSRAMNATALPLLSAVQHRMPLQEGQVAAAGRAAGKSSRRIRNGQA